MRRTLLTLIPPKQRFFLIALILLGAGICLINWQCSFNRDLISYNRQIRPILNKKCLACHGGVRKQGGFSLLFEEEAFAATESGKPAIVAGSAKKSELYRRLVHEDPEFRMPQDGDPLSEEEVALIAEWIDQGAPWEDHWAYRRPRPAAPPLSASGWINNDIDLFVMNRLQEKELEPAPEADRRILMRRLFLDLIGLSPHPDAVDAFAEDPSPDAYERLVDNLMAFPNFGERWAAMWLDLARYADSKGYEKDPYRNIWRYRDWVIDAFNQDMPFDQFTIEQLAGDMLPNPTRDQLIATAFHRNTMTNTEGGTDDEEFRIAAVIDRLNTTYEIWQGTTIGCVQCHSHPYDPFRHEEFYQSFDFFNQSQDMDLDIEAPRLMTLSERDAGRVESVIGFIANLEPQKTIDTNAVWSRQIRQAIFPLLMPIHCDDFENVSLRGDGSVSNWIYNLQSMSHKRFRFMFSDIDLSGLESIDFYYESQGNDAKVEVRLDSQEGRLISEHQFAANAAYNVPWPLKGVGMAKAPVEEMSGRHDLYFEIINTTGKAPEGMVVISDIELKYKDKYPWNPQLINYKHELRTIQANWGDYTPVMKVKTPGMARQTKVFDRGNWMAQTTPVEPKAPEVLLGGEESPSDRLEFARWLVSKDNPLTARVIVNRFWEQLFGRGLVETLEDFGTQSDAPTHPELLDYLALRFMNQHQWSVKSLLREIVMSATYRQSSKATAEKLEADQDNRFLSRGPRFRLSAEQIRDQALTVSGLLYDSIGGPSVMPPQPEGVWQIIYSGEMWETPGNRNRHRRGIYTYWKRTTPYPSMVAFDSPSREFCVSRRIRTNTPLQALVTLNDPVYLEAAKGLARLMREAGGEDLEAGIRHGYKRALAREADEETIAVLTDLFQKAQSELDSVRVRAVAAKEVELSDPMDIVANAILNLDAFLTKD